MPNYYYYYYHYYHHYYCYLEGEQVGDGEALTLTTTTYYTTTTPATWKERKYATARPSEPQHERPHASASSSHSALPSQPP